ncbi:16S rRNA m(4)C1402 methyltransferase [Clostridium thermopalmarium DSM 5974]|uniref:Ribosomal RNA small subunit methyltransferase H n=3 Tax=Clostridiaceae TaxID=31979 RepID=A0A151AKJ1_9CLOT|nr:MULTISPECIES: class I SAM-dependent methyltransferase [Clostridium]KYH28138.1 ribosomal RNA small subunit methyltransferase H [Clostridium colicanis DSM 13634]MBE6043084.1 methyltransferase domain-containing protein [Clostridium thermopalmarium]PRR72682.1 16S rRNA m(4)C1402 methyltransferase [Clostridium thermopalmarium DSM 5974]PVZ20904.1 putative rRNA methylase [Clostridium thermopalmarium DSM 5974]
MKECFFTNSMNLAKNIAIRKLDKGDIAVDATMGNGNDTVFLANLVGEEGKVYSFDIQEVALENTQRKLIENNIFNRVQLIHDGHENIDKYVKENVNLIMFNLGYLPKASHEITTKGETTIIALEKSLKILNKGGVILIVIYYGHENGKVEKEMVEEFTSKLNQKEYNVVRLQFINQINNPPMLIAVEKR